MVTHKFAPLLGKRIRVTQMTDAGVVGANNIVTDGFITATLAAEIEEGTEILTRNAFGQICINERMNPSFKRLTVEINFCGVNPSLLSYISNAVEYLDWAGDVSGFKLPEGEISGSFAFEMWTGLSGAINDPNANGYMLLPFVGKGHLDNLVIDGQNAVDFKMSAGFTRGGHSWGVGPYNVVVGGSMTNAVQSVTITGAPTSGTFTLTFNGQTTTALASTATAADVQAALEALSNVLPGDVAVTGGPGPATAYSVTFAGNFAAQVVPAMTAAGTFTGGTTPAIAVATTTVGSAGVPSKLPQALDSYDHFLLIDTAVSAPTVNEQPTAVTA